MSNAPIGDIYRRLLDAYGPQGWWPADSPFEMMVGAVLTQACGWANAERAISNLRSVGAMSASAIEAIPEPELAGLIRPAGYYNAKARKLKALAAFLIEEFSGDPARMASVPTPRLREMLLAVHGLGEETADDILLYAAGRAVFVVDTYTRRLFSRLGLVDERMAYGDLSRLLARTVSGEERTPGDALVMGEYHALIVRHARESCRKEPRCEGCVLAKGCPTGAERAGGGRTG